MCKHASSFLSFFFAGVDVVFSSPSRLRIARRATADSAEGEQGRLLCDDGTLVLEAQDIRKMICITEFFEGSMEFSGSLTLPTITNQRLYRRVLEEACDRRRTFAGGQVVAVTPAQVVASEPG